MMTTSILSDELKHCVKVVPLVGRADHLVPIFDADTEFRRAGTRRAKSFTFAFLLSLAMTGMFYAAKWIVQLQSRGVI